MERPRRSRLLPALLLIAVAVPRPAEGGAAGPRSGPWRAWLELPGGELPFDLEIREEGGTCRAWISNGPERVPVPETRVEGEVVVMEIPHYDSVLRATFAEDGSRLDGTWRRGDMGRRSVEIPFHATAGDAPRFPPGPAAADDDAQTLPERWVVELEGRPVPSVAVLHGGEDGTVQGTFLHIEGDYRYLEGDFRAGRLRLSRFDGAHAFLFDARMQPDGTLAGMLWEGNYRSESWTARADPEARLQDPFAYLRLREESPDLEDLVGYELDGTPCSLAEKLPSGDALVIEILGTWCPNCHDASKLLMKLREEYGPRGLEVAGLAFQMSGDFRKSSGALRRYVERHGINYPMLLASSGEFVPPAELFPPAAGEFAFPTILFLDRSGRIRATYTGFSGPATGAEHEAMKARWRSVIEDILVEEE